MVDCWHPSDIFIFILKGYFSFRDDLSRKFSYTFFALPEIMDLISDIIKKGLGLELLRESHSRVFSILFVFSA